MEPDRGFGAPLGYADDFQPTGPVRPGRDGSPVRYTSIQNNPRNGDRGSGNGPVPLTYPNGDLPPRHGESGYHNVWQVHGVAERQMSFTGRYVRPHEYVPPVSDIGRPRYNNTGPHDYRSLMTNMGGTRDNYTGPHDYRPPMANMGGPQDNYYRTSRLQPANDQYGWNTRQLYRTSQLQAADDQYGWTTRQLYRTSRLQAADDQYGWNTRQLYRTSRLQAADGQYGWTTRQLLPDLTTTGR